MVKLGRLSKTVYLCCGASTCDCGRRDKIVDRLPFHKAVAAGYVPRALRPKTRHGYVNCPHCRQRNIPAALDCAFCGAPL